MKFRVVRSGKGEGGFQAGLPRDALPESFKVEYAANLPRETAAA
jgi:hypothetical protein